MTLQMNADTQRKLDRLPATLEAEFPDIDAEVVRIEVDTVTREMVANATIEEFLPVLVHRFARDHLLAFGRSGEVATQRWPAESGPG
jgi:hypothetical protein